MAGLSSPGIGSGLDINGLVTKLMEAEKAPLTALAKKEADYQAKLTAYGSLKGALSSFQTAAKGLSTSSKFNTAKATASDATALSATTSSIARTGSYSIEVTSLAQAHKISSKPFVDAVAAVGTGTLTIDFGTYTSDEDGGTFKVNADRTSKTITIDNTNNSLAGIRDAINQAGAGVTASILNDGSGYRLVLSSNESGAANSIRVLVNEDGAEAGDDTDQDKLSRLAFDPTAAVDGGKNLDTDTEVLAADAQLKIDGVAVTKSSNSIGDAIAGVTLNLLKETDGPTTLTVARDPSGVKAAVEGFVKAFNDLAATAKDLGGYDFKTQKGGLLLGDTTLRGVQSQLRNVVNQKLEYADGGVSSLSEIGITFQRDGTLAISATKLDAVLADPAKNVGSLFASLGVPSDSLVSYGGSTASTQPGRYGLEVTRIATRGTATGQQALTLVDGKVAIEADANNLLTLTLNGTKTSVAVTPGNYTPDELVAELQSKINSDSSYRALGYKLTVAQTGNKLSLTSTLYGSKSAVVVNGGSAAATLFGSTQSVTGVDVAGTIGGIAGVGQGQLLTGMGDASGLQLLVEGGNIGARGTVGFSRGIAWQLDDTLGKMLATEGMLEGRTDGIDASIKDLDRQRTAIGKRLEATEKRYRTQFNALDQLVASMQQTSAYLTQQLANLSAMNE